MILSYKYRLYPNASQTEALTEMLADFCSLYNAGLQQRMEAYSRQGISLSFAQQVSELRAIRSADEGLIRWSFTAEQQVLRRVDKAYRAFVKRLWSGKKAGSPRYRSAARYHAADFRVSDGLTLRKSGRIGIVGVPNEIRVKWHRPLLSLPKSAVITRQGRKWFVVFHIEVEVAQPANGPSVGIDLGLSSILALSNGETVARPNWTKRAAKGLRRRQRALSRAQRGSKRRTKAKARLASYSAAVVRRRRDILHKLSADLVNRFAAIAVEDLNINGLARGMLAKEVRDAAWAQLISMLDYKAARAGGQVIKVDPRGTSQTCPECGIIKVKTLAERTHNCDCGCILDRDVAAAKIVRFRAFGPETDPQTPSQQDTAKLVCEAA